MEKPANSENEILALTGLRAVAAFYVFLFHIQIRWPLAHHGVFKKILGQGAIAMSIFFVLSGFILSYRYIDGRTGIKEYLINRFARIYPVYIVAALITLPWFGITLGDYSVGDLIRGILQSVLLIFANVFVIQAWFPQFFDFWNDSGSWSIAVESFCYFLLPFILPILAKCSLSQLKRVAAVCLALATLPGLSEKIFGSSPPDVFYSMPIFRLPEFMIGMCTLLAIRKGLDNSIWTAKAQTKALLFLLIYLAIAGRAMPIYVGHNLIVLPIIAFMIASLANGHGVIAAILSSRIFVWFGKISYCFYSFQAFFILLMIDHHNNLVDAVPIMANNYLFMVTIFVLLIAVSGAAHHWIEEPMRRRIKNYYKAHANKVNDITFITPQA